MSSSAVVSTIYNSTFGSLIHGFIIGSGVYHAVVKEDSYLQTFFAIITPIPYAGYTIYKYNNIIGKKIIKFYSY